MALVSLPLAVDQLFALKADDIGQLLEIDMDPTWSQEGSGHRYERFLSWYQQADSHVACFGMYSYPPLLYEISEPPFLVCYMGDFSSFRKPMISVVGDRFASKRVMLASCSLGLECGKMDIPLVCGYGGPVERTVSIGAAATAGTIVLVSHCGLQYQNPRYRSRLEELLSHDGVCISESIPYESPANRSSTRQNRLVSGMSLTTVVLGATDNSIAMDTVGYALRQGRDVVVHEKGIWEKPYRGSRRLVADGAPIISSLEDVSDMNHTTAPAIVAVDDVAESSAMYRCDSHRPSSALPIRL